MTKEEKEALKKVFDHTRGLLSQSELINILPDGNTKISHSLITAGFIEEVKRVEKARQIEITYYRLTEKGRAVFAPWIERVWINFKTETSLWVGIFSIAFGIFSLFISSAVAFGVPWYQNITDQHNKIEAIYKNLITNDDILMSNSNNARYLLTATSVTALPESYLRDQVSGDIGKILQDKFGLIQYRFFVYYLQKIELLNAETDEMRNALIAGGATSTNYQSARKAYLASIEDLSQEGPTAKFSYVRDVECLTYLFERNFVYLTIDPRGKISACSNESLNRIFQFGFLPRATPKWMLPAFRDALNEKEGGLGDKLIDISEGY